MVVSICCQDPTLAVCCDSVWSKWFLGRRAKTGVSISKSPGLIDYHYGIGSKVRHSCSHWCIYCNNQMNTKIFLFSSYWKLCISVVPEKRTTFVCFFLSQLSMITKMSPENDIQTPYGLHSSNLITSCICVFLRCSQFCHRNQYKLDYHSLSLLCRLACFLKLFGLT